ncbi:MAG: hypothetical protein JST21_05160 [Bacteroidetes bacterium]|nr:hypothetical protein [Bacteroidota bacterium]
MSYIVETICINVADVLVFIENQSLPSGLFLKTQDNVHESIDFTALLNILFGIKVSYQKLKDF